MKINANFYERVVIRPNDYKWVNSPTSGVTRVMLDRMGGEVARATSIVRFKPNSIFPEHYHSGGEEFIVLEGVFSDEHKDYPVGSYVRNPIGTKHSPKIGKEGAIIFVKLRQFDRGDVVQKNINTKKASWYQGAVPGLQVMPLHTFETENVALVKWAPNTKFNSHKHFGGEEIFVLEGSFHDEHGTYKKGTWIRSPHLSCHQPFSLDDGATIFVKTGHLNCYT